MKYLTIGQLAKRVEVHVETIRYYERSELLPKPERKPSGYRLYSEEHVARIRFIRRAKDLGFSLKEISDLLLLVDRDNACTDVLKRTEGKIQEIDQKIRNLKRIKRDLKRMAASCTSDQKDVNCPILESLEGDGAFR